MGLLTIPLDKQGHFWAGYAIMATLFNISPLIGLVAVLGIAGLKELYDSKHPLTHTADKYDFIATTIGGLVAGVLMMFISRIAGGIVQ